jgi:hypothetical protein
MARSLLHLRKSLDARTGQANGWFVSLLFPLAVSLGKTVKRQKWFNENRLIVAFVQKTQQIKSIKAPKTKLTFLTWFVSA